MLSAARWDSQQLDLKSQEGNNVLCTVLVPLLIKVVFLGMI